MRYRPLGRTGQFVSEICLGAMTFRRRRLLARDRLARSGGLDGAGRRARSRRASISSTPPMSIPKASPKSARPGAARSRRQARGRHRRHQGARPHGAWAERHRPVARPHHGPDRRQPEAPRPRPCRPLSDPWLRPGDADRGDAAGARRLRARGMVRTIGCSNLAAWQIMKALASPTGAAWRGSRPCRPITRSPAANSSARSCRWSRTRGSA